MIARLIPVAEQSEYKVTLIMYEKFASASRLYFHTLLAYSFYVIPPFSGTSRSFISG